MCRLVSETQLRTVHVTLKVYLKDVTFHDHTKGFRFLQNQGRVHRSVQIRLQLVVRLRSGGWSMFGALNETTLLACPELEVSVEADLLSIPSTNKLTPPKVFSNFQREWGELGSLEFRSIRTILAM